MSRLFRAAAYAVASLMVAFGATYDGPAFAEEAEAVVPVTPVYIDHSIAGPGAEPGIAETFATPAFDPNLTPDVAEHVVAPLVEDEAPKNGRSLADLVADYASTEAPDAEHDCLAGAVYFESKGEPLHGQLAVAEVILNRASSGKYPRSICGVVTQKSQFSFVRGGRIPAIPRSSEAWKKAVAIAHIAKKDLADSDAENALFFHARYVSPRWRLTRVASIGNHIFYR
ncbi:MAG TPA: cell wall hydrolase [Allosphingosinicella sp.]|uniref:cell wall hydrolase n=1 Tax=Allosphingosinicella sp. TaxID=2823234 RepID=UPI002ED91294